MYSPLMQSKFTNLEQKLFSTYDSFNKIPRRIYDFSKKHKENIGGTILYSTLTAVTMALAKYSYDTLLPIMESLPTESAINAGKLVAYFAIGTTALSVPLGIVIAVNSERIQNFLTRSYTSLRRI